MNKYELLDLIGEADENYVLAADENVIRPKFRWQPWAAAAACAALICAAVYPHMLPHIQPAGGANDMAAGPDSSQVESDDAFDEEPVKEMEPTVVQRPGLHEYTLIEGELRVADTQGSDKAPAVGVDDAGQEAGPVPAPALPAPNANAPVAGGFEGAPADVPYDPDGVAFPSYEAETAIDQDEGTRQYQSLLKNGGIGYAGEGYYPEWFGGAWLDNDWPDNVSRLTVAIVEGWDTEAMENTVRSWCGGTGDVLFCTAKYSYAHLNGLMSEISTVFDQYGWLPSSHGVNEEANRIELDIFGMPSDGLLADLARLDPDGDAIRVQVFTDRTIQFTDDAVMKPPASAVESEAEPTPMEEPDGWEEDIPADPGEICRLPLAKPEGE